MYAIIDSATASLHFSAADCAETAIRDVMVDLCRTVAPAACYVAQINSCDVPALDAWHNKHAFDGIWPVHLIAGTIFSADEINAF